MKNALLLTSLLALCACGGGAGGGGMPMSDIERVTTLGTGASNSNAAITTMSPEIIVANDGSGSFTRPSTRAATNVVYNDKTYTVYKLDDIDLKLADNSGGDIYFNFKLDEAGRIDSGSLTTGVNPSNTSENLTVDLVRDGDTARFNGAVLEYVYNDKTYLRVADNGTITLEQLDDMVGDATLARIPQEAKDNGRWDRMNQVWEIETTGDDAGLQYADFGYLKTANLVKDKNITSESDLAAARNGTRTGSNHNEYNNIDAQLSSGDYFMFAGGYEINSVPTTNTTFRGTAHGKVYTSVLADTNKDTYKSWYKNNPSNPDEQISGDNAMAFDTTNATLTFTAGSTPTEVLYMPFGTDGASFYDVTVTKEGESSTFAFNKPDGVTIDRKFQQDSLSNIHAGASIGAENKNVNFGYHGVNAAAEATGTVKFTQDTTLNAGDNARREFQFEAAFGGKKQ